jgi:hypothetical protein
VVAAALQQLIQHPQVVVDWRHLLTTTYGSPLAMVAMALVVFPKLALSLSGFETGVAVMPLVRGSPTDTPERPEGRIRNTHSDGRAAQHRAQVPAPLRHGARVDPGGAPAGAGAHLRRLRDTLLFRADVEAQGGAYATGVLVLMWSAAIAVTLSARRRHRRSEAMAFGLITLVFAYATVAKSSSDPRGSASPRSSSSRS